MRTKLVLTVVLLLCLSTSALAQRGAIVNESFTVDAGAFRYWSFTVSQRPGVRVFGRFRATGGSGRDIECYILDEDAFENYQTGHTVSSKYNSGRVTVGRMNVLLRPGNWFLVFSNRFSVLTPKAVSATVYIEPGPPE
jgi:hypothetical protein